MVKHLEADYEVTSRSFGFVSHFFDTIEALGGWKGLAIATLGILAFYLYVDWTITSGRAKREAKKSR